ncbi:MAG: hypothetical protein JRK53_16780 [Deltaproteobacteria bacterium]|nr:hypothetical protein [Deltaproteobacteria bacterium]MBW1817749.1 hypothetical protein [Deltaproteobacteria bacterium]MBW2284516.1 hypothetical protein [Deltaproteobacteria bacterium]
MRFKHDAIAAIIAFFLVLAWASPGIGSGLEWTVEAEVELDALPLDTAPSTDGKWIFILVPGEIQAYSSAEGKITIRIPVDKSFDRLSYSPKQQALILTSGAGKKFQVLKLETVHDIDTSGLPFKGPENAPVTIVVFGDFQ